MPKASADALRVAIDNGRLANVLLVTRECVDAGINIVEGEAGELPPLFHAAAYGGHASGGAIRILVEEGHLDPNSQHDGWSPLMYAVTRGVLGAVKELLAAGADPNWVDPASDLSLLQFAVVLRDEKAVKLLVEAGADIGRVSTVDTRAVLSESEAGRALLWALG